MNKDVSHADLVIRASRYLSGYCNCNPVFTEQGSAQAREMPDAIGWTTSKCYVIECKTCVADCTADKIKPSRKDENAGLGDFRFYLLTLKLFERIEQKLDLYIPEKWGILIHDIPYCRRMKFREAKPCQSNVQAEIQFLRSRILEIQRFGK
jgi:hypothetical protein